MVQVGSGRGEKAAGEIECLLRTRVRGWVTFTPSKAEKQGVFVYGFPFLTQNTSSSAHRELEWLQLTWSLEMTVLQLYESFLWEGASV